MRNSRELPAMLRLSPPIGYVEFPVLVHITYNREHFGGDSEFAAVTCGTAGGEMTKKVISKLKNWFFSFLSDNSE